MTLAWSFLFNKKEFCLSLTGFNKLLSLPQAVTHNEVPISCQAPDQTDTSNPSGRPLTPPFPHQETMALRGGDTFSESAARMSTQMCLTPKLSLAVRSA